MMSFKYVFDLTRRAEGLVVAAKVDQSADIVFCMPRHWQCAARDDVDAMRQATQAAEREWPAVARRKCKDFVVKFVSQDALGAMARQQRQAPVAARNLQLHGASPII